jgi:hypothetical protein
VQTGDGQAHRQAKAALELLHGVAEQLQVRAGSGSLHLVDDEQHTGSALAGQLAQALQQRQELAGVETGHLD